MSLYPPRPVDIVRSIGRAAYDALGRVEQGRLCEQYRLLSLPEDGSRIYLVPRWLIRILQPEGIEA